MRAKIQDINQGNNRARVEAAVVEVIRAAGFDAMAKQFIEEPDKRLRIIFATAARISAKLGKERAARFVDLAMNLVQDNE